MPSHPFSIFLVLFCIGIASSGLANDSGHSNSSDFNDIRNNLYRFEQEQREERIRPIQKLVLEKENETRSEEDRRREKNELMIRKQWEAQQKELNERRLRLAEIELEKDNKLALEMMKDYLRKTEDSNDPKSLINRRKDISPLEWFEINGR